MKFPLVDDHPLVREALLDLGLPDGSGLALIDPIGATSFGTAVVVPARQRAAILKRWNDLILAH